jgi:hypothetical protein
MPNWVSINLTVECDDQAKLQAFIKAVEQEEEDGGVVPFSFHKIIPRPEILERTIEGSLSSIGYDAWYGDPTKVLSYPWIKQAGVVTAKELQDFLEKSDPGYKEQADLRKKALDETGYGSWYDWSIENWGTKWGACSPEIVNQSEHSIEYKFDTAWSFPEPVIRKMAELFPELSFHGDAIEESDAFECDFSYSPGDELSITYSTPNREEAVAEAIGEEISTETENNWF